MFKLLVVSAVVALAFAAPSTKVHPTLRATLQTKATANIFITLKADTYPVLANLGRTTFANRDERLVAVTSALKSHAADTQKSLLEFLSAKPFTTVESFWISNQVYVRNADAGLISEIASRPDVSEITEEVIIYIEPLDVVHEPEGTVREARAEWGVDKIQSQQAWNLPGGNNGAGVVVANVDTGVRQTHQDLAGNYLGTYGWRDPYQSTAAPNDQNGHGTHTIGTIAGQNGIGVAPGSRWMACKGCSTSQCTQNALLTCGQFIACPTLPNGGSPDCTKAPHVVNNSWGGGRGETWYNSAIAAWHAAGIIPVFSNGNSGPACNTANSPADQNCIGVGSSTTNDGLSSFSSKGPRAAGGVKPDISAPGANVRSASHTSNTAYATMSGTSMAGPHVAGVVALLQGRNPNLSYAQIQNLLFNGADRAVVQTGQNCGGINESVWPNNAFGHGRVNAFRSLGNLISGKDI